MKVIIAGSRTFNNYNFLKEKMKEIPEVEEVVCGLAKGADSLGHQWAQLHNIPITTFPAQWGKYGKAAGMMRNKEMAEYADFLVAFWDGQSPGTKDMIEQMKKVGKHGRIYLI